MRVYKISASLVIALVANFLYPASALAAVVNGAAVICDASNTANVSTSSCVNTGSSGTNTTLSGSPVRGTRGQGSIGFNQSSRGQYGTGSIGSTTGIDSITVEMFLYLSANGNIYNTSGSMVFQFANSSASYNIYHYQHYLGFNTFNSEVYGIDATTLEDAWHHYVFVGSTSATDGVQAIYVDGVKQSLSFVFGSSSISSSKVFDSTGAFRLMDHAISANTWNAKGEVGLLRIYKRALTLAEVQANYQAEQWRLSTATSFASLTLSNSPKKGVVTTLTATVSNLGKVRFFSSGKRIAKCVSVTTTGTGPYTATCLWTPTVSGGVILSAHLYPTDNGLTGSDSALLPVITGRRVSVR